MNSIQKFQNIHAAVLLAGLCLLCGVNVAAAAEQDDPDRPNVLFIAIDDLNDWVGCLGGHPQALTPNIDRLAERGVLFTNAHCDAPVCKSSRAAVFSGLSPRRTEIYGNKSPNLLSRVDVSKLLPAHFSAAGYETLGTGKLLHGGGEEIFDRGYATEQRWSPFTREQTDYTEAELPGKGSANPRHEIKNGPGGRDWVLPLNGLPSERHPEKLNGESFDWGPVDVADEEMGDGRITDWAIERLAEKRDKLFFLAVGYYRPHIPLFAPRKDFDALPPLEEILLPKVKQDDLDDLGPVARELALTALTAGSHQLVADSGQWREAVRAYLACVHLVDRQIGRLLAALEDGGHSDNTLVVLWSDHGWHLGEKQHWGKWTGWRDSTRVPLIVAGPGVATGERCHVPVSLLDLFPTFVDRCRLAVLDDLDGETLTPLLIEPETASDRTVATWFDAPNVALSTSRWRYLRYGDNEQELYDLRHDPDEWDNLASDVSTTSSGKTATTAASAAIAFEHREALERFSKIYHQLTESQP